MACSNERGDTVKNALQEAFGRYGLPWERLMDNGSPWGRGGDSPDTALRVWLMRLGIVVCHGRRAHPQTQGKEDRFHATLKAELLGEGRPWSLEQCQRRFDEWRYICNTQRPHEALGLDTPVSPCQISTRGTPESLPPVEYGPKDEVGAVHARGRLSYRSQEDWVSQAFCGQPVALRPHPQKEGVMEVYFCRQRIAHIDLTKNTETN